MTRYPLIGIDPNDPYGRIMCNIFARNRLSYDITIKARFGTTVCALVKAGLGIAVIDQFTLAHVGYPGVELIRIVEPTRFDTYIAVKRGAAVAARRIFHQRIARGDACFGARQDRGKGRPSARPKKITSC